MKTIPNTHAHSGRSHDRFHLAADSDLAPLADAARAHTRAGIDRIERLAEIVLLTTARDHGLFDDAPVPTTTLAAPLRIDTIAASLARTNGHHFAGPATDPNPPDIATAGTTVPPSPDAQIPSPSDSVESDPVEPPLFPDFTLKQTFHQWTHDNLTTTDLPVLSTLLGTSKHGTETTAAHAMTLTQGLPRFLAKAKTGAYTMEHIDTAARLCLTVAFEHLPTLDAYLCAKRSDITVDTFRTALRKQIALLEDTADRQESIRCQRRVEKTSSRGVGYLTLIGPALEIEAAYRRVEGMARAIRLGNTDCFGLTPGDMIDDERSIAALMFDTFIRPVPELSVTVTTTNQTTGISQATTTPWTDDPTDPSAPGGFYDEAGDPIPLTDEDAAQAGAAARAGNACHSSAADQSSAFFSDSAADPITTKREVTLRMPTSEWWMASQAKLIATVPFITAFTNGNLPGTLPDGSPIPPDDARRLVGCSTTLTRVLTDPATGTPLDAKALTYRIPSSVRTTLIAKYQTCSMPGCTRRADTGEIDHIEEFFHLNPSKGGPTTFANLHVLCRACHALKTARKLDVTMTRNGDLEYTFPHGMTTTITAPDDPINATQARILHALCEPKPPPPWLPPRLRHTSNSNSNDHANTGTDDGTTAPQGPTVSISPGLQEKWARGLRWLYDTVTRIRRLTSALQLHLWHEHQKWVRLRNCLDWEHAVFPTALPPAPIRLALPPGDPELERQRIARRRAIKKSARRIKADMDFWGKNVPRKLKPGEKLQSYHWDSPWDYDRDRIDPDDGLDDIIWDHDPDTDPPPF